MLRWNLGLVVLLGCFFTQITPAVFAQDNPGFIEVMASAGKMLSPAASPSYSGGIGVGAGKSSLSLEVGHDVLGNVELGSRDLPIPVVNSIIKDLNVNYRRDVFGAGKNAFVYGLAGFAFLRSSDSRNYNDVCNTPSTCAQYPANVTRSVPGLALGGGVRIPVAAGFGIRLELQSLLTKGGNADLKFINFDQTTPVGSDHLVRITLGIYYRRLNHHM